MKISFAGGMLCGALAAAFAAAPAARAQSQNAGPNMMQESNSMSDRLFAGTSDTEADRTQGSAYQNFLKERDLAKKIKLGNEFLQRYPKSPLAEQVDVGMMSTYRAQQDWENAYLWADHALALQPDDVDVLATIGWTIPHVYSPKDADADQQLDKAEAYAKHAIDVLAKLPKPATMNDAQFAAAKTKRSVQAHSALGLVYFRRDDYDKSAKELALATKDATAPDATDLFVLGVDLQNTRQFGDAAEAFGRCGEVAGPLQAQCKQLAAQTKAQAEVSKPK